MYFIFWKCSQILTFDTKSSQIARTSLWSFDLAYSPLNCGILRCSSEVTLMSLDLIISEFVLSSWSLLMSFMMKVLTMQTSFLTDKNMHPFLKSLWAYLRAECREKFFRLSIKDVLIFFFFHFFTTSSPWNCDLNVRAQWLELSCCKKQQKQVQTKKLVWGIGDVWIF